MSQTSQNTSIAQQLYLRVSQLEDEHRLFREIVDRLHASAGGSFSIEDLVALQKENTELRRKLAENRQHAVYDDWFESVFGVKVPAANTWPFTTFKQGTPWSDKVVYGMQDGEHLFAEDLFNRLERDRVPGAVVEFGTYFGHWMQVLAEMQERRGWSREFWGFDSFEGLPEPDKELNPQVWTKGMYTAPFDEVKARLQVDKRPWIKLVKGWFSDTLIQSPAVDVADVAYARVDGDLYESCVDCLRYLEPRLADGSILVFDDWQFSVNHGETRAFREWVEKGVPFRFEYLGFNMWAHLYLRVHHVRT